MADKETWLPDDVQELLLGAVLKDDTRSFDCYLKWKERVDLDSLCDSSFFLLPMLYTLMEQKIINDRIMAKAKGVHHQCYYKNALAFNGYLNIINELLNKGIKCYISGDALLLNFIYKDQGARKLMASEIFVEEGDIKEALNIILSESFKPQEPGYDFCLKTSPDICLYDENKNRLYLGIKDKKKLYWNGTRWCLECMIPLETPDLNAALLSCILEYEKLLVSVIIGGTMGCCEADLVWIMDSAYIIKASGEKFDWNVFINEIKKTGLVLHIQRGISCLKKHIDIPEWAYRDLMLLPVSKWEMKLYRRGTSSGALRRLNFLWLSCSHIYDGINPTGFIKLLKCRYETSSILRLFSKAIKRRCRQL